MTPEDEERTTELDLETTPRGRGEDTRGGSGEAQQGLAGGLSASSFRFFISVRLKVGGLF